MFLMGNLYVHLTPKHSSKEEPFVCKSHYLKSDPILARCSNGSHTLQDCTAHQARAPPVQGAVRPGGRPLEVLLRGSDGGVHVLQLRHSRLAVSCLKVGSEQTRMLRR
jgi:hypothetical protein